MRIGEVFETGTVSKKTGSAKMTEDQTLAYSILTVEREYESKGRLDEFEKYALEILPDFKNDNTYWQAVAACWIKAGTQKRREEWRTLLTARRRNRHKLMKKGDRKRWRNLPAHVTAYRAINDERDAEVAFSWTLEKRTAERLSRGRQIVNRTFRKKDIIALFTRRGEAEIIVIPGSRS